MPALKLHLEIARTPEELVQERQRMVKHHEELSGETGPVVFTYDDCGAAPTCTFVFDGYNTDGDCLASK